MLRIKSVFLIILIIVGNVGCVEITDENPDQNVLDGGSPSKAYHIANSFDSIYYPEFIRALEAIKKNDFSMLEQYFNNNLTDTATPGYKVDQFYFDQNIHFHFMRSVASQGNYEIPFPVDWKASPYGERNWELFFHSLTWIKPYLNSESIDTLQNSLAIIDDWIVNHTGYPDLDEEFAFNDHASSVRMEILSKAIDRCEEAGFTQGVPYLRLRMAFLAHLFFRSSLERYFSWHNHGIITDEAIVHSLIDRHEFRLRDAFLNLANTRISQQFLYCFTSEGIHKEHTPCYHDLITRKLNDYISTASELGLEVEPSLRNIDAKANQYYSYIVDHGHLLKFGDCSGKEFDLNKVNINQDFEFKVFPESGWAFFNYGSLKVTYQADFFSKVHYHQDETSFILKANGDDIIIDPGIYSYNYNDISSYAKSARAHNLLMVDHSDFELDFKKCGLSGITRYLQNNNPEYSWKAIVETTHPHYSNKNISIYRQLGIVNDSTVLVRDLVNSSESHQYDQLFHLAPGARVENGDGVLKVSFDSTEYYLYVFTRYDKYRVIEGDTLNWQGWNFPRFLEFEPSPVLILSNTVTNYNFETYLIITKSKSVQGGIEEEIIKTAENMVSALEKIPEKKLIATKPPKKWKPSRKSN